MKTTPPVTKADDATVIDAMRRTPAVQTALVERQAQIVLARRGLQQQLRAMERDAERAYPKMIAADEAAIAEHAKAERAYLDAGRRLNEHMARRSTASFAYSAERARLEEQLRETADTAAIDAFRSWCLGDLDRTRAAIETREDVKRNAITGRATRTTRNNGASIAARVSAINTALQTAEALRFEPDQSTVPARLEELRASLPPIERLVIAGERDRV